MKFSYLLLGTCLLTAMGISACQAEKTTTKIAAPANSKQEAGLVKSVAEYPTRLLWGDTHLHTLNSADAFSFGARLSPSDAYKFARGDEVISNTGQRAKLKRPLDFLVVADHAEGLGISNELFIANPVLMTDAKARRWNKMLNAGPKQSAMVGKEMILSLANGTLPEPMMNRKKIVPLMRSIWQRNTEVAEQYNAPGIFTALIGYEYTSTPSGNNLHRIVLFRDGKR